MAGVVGREARQQDEVAGGGLAALHEVQPDRQLVRLLCSLQRSTVRVAATVSPSRPLLHSLAAELEPLFVANKVQGVGLEAGLVERVSGGLLGRLERTKTVGVTSAVVGHDIPRGLGNAALLPCVCSNGFVSDRG